MTKDIAETFLAVLEGRPPVELVARAAGVPPLDIITAEAWLNGSPLMRALQAELARRPWTPVATERA